MRNVMINGERFYEDKIYGTIRHTYELLLELDKIVPQNSITVFAPQCELEQLENIRIKKVGVISKHAGYKQKISRVIWKYGLLPMHCMLHNAVSINLFPVWGYYAFNAESIYDCTPEGYYMKNDFGEEIRQWWSRLVKNQQRAVSRCTLVLTDSESAKKDIIKYYGLKEDRIKVIPCGWQHVLRVKEDNEILKKLALQDKHFFFSLGSRLPHKNIRWVSEAARKYPEYTFVVTGKERVNDSSFEGNPHKNMIFTGYLSDGEIKALMRHCKAFIQPSLYEGFGIPPLEAMSVGADCILSDIPVFREVYKNSVWYMDPNDYEHIDLEKIMSAPKEGNDVILNEYSWEKSARKLLDVIRELAGWPDPAADCGRT